MKTMYEKERQDFEEMSKKLDGISELAIDKDLFLEAYVSLALITKGNFKRNNVEEVVNYLLPRLKETLNKNSKTS